MIAALFVDAKGAYAGLPDVDIWPQERDARTYAGPWPVVAHPPCERWCKLAKFVQSRHPARRVGDDGGCFAAALEAVRRWGGVLEHPAWSLAWSAHHLAVPPTHGWQYRFVGSWVCEVAQSAYGHRARKLSWLYYVGDAPPPSLDWSKPRGSHVVSFCSRRADGSFWRDARPKARRSERTPPEFRDLLLTIARGARRTEAA